MKKHILIVLLIFTMSLGFGVNVDYGISVDSFAGTDFTDVEDIFGYEKVSIYSSIAVTEQVSFNIDAFYKFAYPGDEPHTVDISTLIATFPVGNISFQLGRSTMSDYSGDIFSQTLDGAIITVPFGSSFLIVNAGASSLVNRGEVSLLTSAVDADEDYITEVVEGIDFVKKFDALAVWGSVYSYQDINRFDNNLGIYVGSGVQGTIGTDIFYTLRGNFKTGQFNYLEAESGDETSSTVLAGMGAFSLNWYMNIDKIKSLSPVLNADIGMSSGDANITATSIGEIQSNDITDTVNIYSPMVSGAPGSIYSISNQNLTYVKISGSIAPLKVLQTQIGSVLYFRTVEGSISDTSYDSEASGNYLGTEVSATINYRPFSDLGFSLNGGAFFPDGTILTSDPSGMLTLYVSLSL